MMPLSRSPTCARLRVEHADGTIDAEAGQVVHVEPREEVIFSQFFAGAFLSSSRLAEQSSPSRVRFAAPNNGAPLTAPGCSEQHLLGGEKGSFQKAADNLGAKGAKMAPFSLPPTDLEARLKPGGEPMVIEITLRWRIEGRLIHISAAGATDIVLSKANSEFWI